jgi:hypothetical protein
MPNFVHSVMVLGNLVLLVSALGCVPVMIVACGKLSKFPIKPSIGCTSANLGSVDETGGRSTRSTHTQHPKKTQQNKSGGIKSVQQKFKS